MIMLIPIIILGAFQLRSEGKLNFEGLFLEPL